MRCSGGARRDRRGRRHRGAVLQGLQPFLVQLVRRRPWDGFRLRREDGNDAGVWFAEGPEGLGTSAGLAEYLGDQASDGHGQAERLIALPAKLIDVPMGSEPVTAWPADGQPNLDAARGPVLRPDDGAVLAGQDRIVGPDVFEYGCLQGGPGRDLELILSRQPGAGAVRPDHRREEALNIAFQRGDPASVTGLAHGPVGLVGRRGPCCDRPRVAEGTALTFDIRLLGGTR